MKITKQAVMKKIKALWNDESAQGATEYILLLAIVVGVVMFFGPKIKEMVKGKMGEIGGAMDAIKPSAE